MAPRARLSDDTWSILAISNFDGCCTLFSRPHLAYDFRDSYTRWASCGLAPSSFKDFCAIPVKYEMPSVSCLLGRPFDKCVVSLLSVPPGVTRFRYCHV